MIDFASKMTKDQARALLRRAGLLNKMRVIEGAEREKTLTMLRLVPFESSNNQHLWTQSWKVGDVTYDLVCGNGVDALIETTKDHEIDQ